MAEAQAYGKALGAQADLALLNSILVRATPQIPAQQMQDTTRYGALTAWTILQKHAAAYAHLGRCLRFGCSRSHAGRAMFPWLLEVLLNASRGIY